MTAFTIVIAIRNAAVDLPATLDSLNTQTLRDFEVIIADCNSTDNPAQVLQDRPYPIQHVVQSDTGIYDAWNKVLPHARGEWVMFMGAGDQLATNQTLASAAGYLATLPHETLIAYGKIDAIGENGQVLHTTGKPWPRQLCEIAAFFSYPHQATFQRRRSFAEHGYFDSQLAIAGDIDMVLRLAKVCTPTFIDAKIACFQFGGISNRPESRKDVVNEHFAVLKRYSIKPEKRLLVMWKAQVVTVLNSYVPQKVLHVIIDLYRQITGRKLRFR